MLYQLTLVRNPSAPPFHEAEIARILETARQTGFLPGEWTWLSIGQAGSVVLEGDSVAALRDRLDNWGGLEADIFLLPGAAGPKKLLVADMESTMIENEFLEDLAAFAGVRERVKTITARAMHGEIDFAGALTERVALLRDLPVDCVETALKSLRISGGARELVATMKSRGAGTALVSGGFTCFTGRVGALLGFDHLLANQLETRNGRLTGSLLGPIVDAASKARFLRSLCDRLGISESDVVAVGDGANDIEMIKAAGLGVGYRPKPAVAAVCDIRIEHGDLSALLYAQGYHASEFARDGAAV